MSVKTVLCLLALLVVFAPIGHTASVKRFPPVPFVPTHIVVGAGTAGCALAARLSENPNYNVLLIGEGDVQTNSPFNALTLVTPLPNIPSGGAMRYADILQTIEGVDTARTPLNEQVAHIVGGASEINGGIFLPVANSDYDLLLTEYGINGWNASYMSTHIRPKIENFIADGGVVMPSSASQNGTIDIRAVSPDLFLSGILDGLLSVTNAPYNPDFGSGNMSGLGVFWRSLGGNNPNASLPSGGFVRQGSYEKYLANIVQTRTNLHVVTGASVVSVGSSPICFSTNTVCIDQVTYGRNGIFETITVMPGGEVLLSAGAFGSAKLLMHSGFGDCAMLLQYNIPCRVNLPAIGSAVKEQFSVINPISIIPIESPNLMEHLGAVIGGYISANSSIVELFYNAVPDGELVLLLAGAGVNKPTSVGTLQLRGSDWTQPLNYSSGVTAADLVPVCTGFRALRAGAAAFMADTGIPVIEITPGIADDEATILTWLQTNIGVSWHVSSTVPMGVCGTTGAAVDDHLRVCGTRGLRVIDGGVYPDHYFAHSYHFGALMIAERGAEIIQGHF